MGLGELTEPFALEGRTQQQGLTSSANTQAHILGLGLVHPNICNLLEGARGLVLHNDNRRTYMTWENNRLSREEF